MRICSVLFYVGVNRSLASASVSLSHLRFEFFVFQTGSVLGGKEALWVLFATSSEHIHHLVRCFDESEISCSCVVRCTLLAKQWSTSAFGDRFLDHLVGLLLCVSAVFPLFSCLLPDDAIRRLSKHRLERSLDATCHLALSGLSVCISLLASLFLLPLVKDLCSSFGLGEVHGLRARRLNLSGSLAPLGRCKLLLQRLGHLIASGLSLTLIDVGSVENLTRISGCPLG